MCQKRAALDVVYQRLDKIGLVKYVALLHDPNKDRKALYQHIERLLKSNATLNSLDQGADSALIYCCQQIDDIRARQNSIVTALSKKYFGGVSIHQLYSVAKPGYLPKLDLSGIAEKIEYPILTQVLETARNLEYPCKKFDIPTNYPWRHRKDFSKISFADKNNLLNLIDELVTLTNERDRCILTYDSNDQQELFESLNELTTILNHFCDIETSCKKFDVPEHPWFNRSNFSTLTLNEKNKVDEILDKMLTLIKEEKSATILTKDIHEQKILYDSLDILATEGGRFRKLKPRWIEARSNVKRLLKKENDIAEDVDYINDLKQGAKKGLQLWKGANDLKHFINDDGFDQIKNNLLSSSKETETLYSFLSNMRQSLQDFNELVDHDKKRKQLLSKENELQNRWKFTQSNVTRLLKQTNIQNNNDIISYLTQKIRVANNTAADNLSALINYIGFNEFRITTLTSLEAQDQFFSKLTKLSNMVDLLRKKVKKGITILDTVDNISAFLNNIEFNEFKNEFVSSDLDSIRHNLFSMKETLLHDFDEVQGYDAKKALLTPIQKQILDLCKTRLSTEDNWDEILRQEFYLHWIDYIEQAHPQLKGQPFESYLQNCERLSHLIKEHRKLVVRMIARQIEKAIVRPDVRLRKRTTTASYKQQRQQQEDLKWTKLTHELGKKRHILSVRKLIENYESIIFNTIPCWLASPEAVSAIFPLKRKLFDLIIFDEASQTAVEKALGVLYRGDHIVITGDEKQLRPFDLFRVKGDEEYEDEEYEDEEYEEELIDDTLLSESLLILGKKIYGKSNLKWHYRSKYQELIDFSNHAFYDGDLQIAPSVWRAPPIAPIRWVTCKNGSWVNRKNMPEAAVVVDELKNILLCSSKKESGDTVGIITFNNAQQEAIQDEIDERRNEDPLFDNLLSDAENPQSNRLDDKLFVKNIENVQGDERDIIIFSIGYAKDPENPEGELPIRFGTLNQQGGENRLNVAVTRARKEIVVVCSIDPNRLNTDSVKNDGPKRMKDYLCYAKLISEGRKENARQIEMIS